MMKKPKYQFKTVEARDAFRCPISEGWEEIDTFTKGVTRKLLFGGQKKETLLFKKFKRDITPIKVKFVLLVPRWATLDPLSNGLDIIELEDQIRQGIMMHKLGRLYKE